MAYIKYADFDPNNIDKELADVIEKYYGKVCRPDNIVGISGCAPHMMEGHMALYRSVMYGKSNIRRPQREMIAVMVSGFNDCFY